MARKPHPADVYAADQIAKATAWCAIYPGARGAFTRVECTSEAHAHAEAARLTREMGQDSGRRACAYAITAEGRSFPLSGVPFRTSAERAADRRG